MTRTRRRGGPSSRSLLIVVNVAIYFGIQHPKSADAEALVRVPLGGVPCELAHRQAGRRRPRRHAGRAERVRRPRRAASTRPQPVVPAEERLARAVLLDVPARLDPARARQHVVLVDLRQQRRGPTRARSGFSRSISSADSSRRSYTSRATCTRPSPLLGASGAIAVVMGAYIVWWPRARVLTLVTIISSSPALSAGRARARLLVRVAVLHPVVERASRRSRTSAASSSACSSPSRSRASRGFPRGRRRRRRARTPEPARCGAAPNAPTMSRRELAEIGRDERRARIGNRPPHRRVPAMPDSTSANGHPSAAANAPSVDGRSPIITTGAAVACAHHRRHRRPRACPRPRVDARPRSRPRRRAIPRPAASPSAPGYVGSRFVATNGTPARTPSAAAAQPLEVEVAMPADDDRVGGRGVDRRRSPRASTASTHARAPRTRAPARRRGRVASQQRPRPARSSRRRRDRRSRRRRRAGPRCRARARSSCSSGTRPAARRRAARATAGRARRSASRRATRPRRGRSTRPATVRRLAHGAHGVPSGRSLGWSSRRLLERGR